MLGAIVLAPEHTGTHRSDEGFSGDRAVCERVSLSRGERLLLLSVTSRKLGSGGRPSTSLLEGWVGGWLDGPPAPGRRPILNCGGGEKKKRRDGGTKTSGISWPGLGEGMLWN